LHFTYSLFSAFIIIIIIIILFVHKNNFIKTQQRTTRERDRQG